MAQSTLSNNIRESLIKQHRAKGCLVWEFSLFTIGSNTPFTVKELTDNGLNERLAREGLQDSGLFSASTAAPSGKGRPSVVYAALHPVNVMESLGLENTGHKDPIPQEAFLNVPTYKQALHKAMILRMQTEGDNFTKSQNSKLSPCVRYGNYGESWFEMSRKFQGNRLNVSASTLRRYEKNSKILTQAQFTEIEITEDMSFSLPSKVDKNSSQNRFIEDANGKRYPAVSYIARRLLYRDGFYTLKTQLCNLYRCA